MKEFTAKKFAALFLAVIMVVSLSACAMGDNGNPNRSNSDSVENSNSANGSSKIDSFRNTSGKTSGIVGDTMSTKWFDFTVNSVSEYGNKYMGFTANHGYRLLVVNVTIENTFDDVNPMFDDDFSISWGNSDDDYDYPVPDAKNLSDDILPSEYYMEPGERVTGDLLFEIPADETALTISYVEIDDQDTVYNTYKVSFQVEAYAFEGDTIIGELGDTMSPYWFDFSVDDAILTTEYEGSRPSAGKVYLVLTMTLENTYHEAVPMYNSDFDVEWDDPEEESYEIPVRIFINGEELTEGTYEIPYADIVDAVMVYEVDKGYDEFTVYFDEIFADDTSGNVLGVHLVPEKD